MDVLDDPRTVERLDREGMLGRIEGLPEQCREAWNVARGVSLPAAYRGARAVVVAGMGGSAIGGDLFRALASASATVPVVVVRGYDLPAWVGPQTVVVYSSHSGETEETLSVFDQGVAAGAMGIVVSTGGLLTDRARERGVPVVAYSYAGEPRSALGWQLMSLLALGESLGLLSGVDEAVAEAVAVLEGQRQEIGWERPIEVNPAKRMAHWFHGQLPVVFGSGLLAEAAHRWKTQFNENAKCWAFWDELPELNHNAIAGFGLPAEGIGRLRVAFLRSPGLHPRVLLRYAATGDALTAAGVQWQVVEARGSSALSQALAVIHFGDMVTYYLALLNGEEPSPVRAIAALKHRLAQA